MKSYRCENCGANLKSNQCAYCDTYYIYGGFEKESPIVSGTYNVFIGCKAGYSIGCLLGVPAEKAIKSLKQLAQVGI